MAFEGFGPDTIEFLRELSGNNDREWFADNRERYETAIRANAESFILELGSRLAAPYPSVVYDIRRNGAGSLMRINRDIRFSPDKRPYKENVGIIFPLAPGKKVEAPIFYFHIEPGSAFFYGGQHVFAPEVLERYRQAVDDPKTGKSLGDILELLRSEGIRPMEEPSYKRVPRPYAADHPRADLLRQAALGVGIDLGPEDLARTGLVDRCLEAALRMKPLMEWIGAMNSRVPR